MDLLARIPAEIRTVARRLHEAGATRVVLVGGSVIDLLQGRAVKDWDIEVAGLGMRRLTEIAGQMGHADEVGRAFGIVKLKLPSGLDVDFNVPRRDSKAGQGHRAFDITIDPNMTVTEAARRRDFTINTLGLDLQTGVLYDPFGGLKDLEEGILRVTDPDQFADDPLRVLRAAQLVARKVERVDPEAVRLFRRMASEQHTLPKERVLAEWRKLLLSGVAPSRGLELLREAGWLPEELAVLADVPQHPDWHPEGDVWVHTKQAADAAALVREFVPEDQREAFMFGTMLHDVGKAVTTVRPEDVAAGRAPQDRLLTAYGHDVAGRPIARKFLTRIGASNRTIDLAEAIVGEHMQPYNLTQGAAGRAAYARLHRRLAAVGGDLHLLSRVCQCDACATGRMKRFVRGEPDWEHTTSRTLQTWAEDVGRTASKPFVQGRDLIAWGFKPGRQFTPVLAYAQDLQDAGHTEMEVRRATQQYAQELMGMKKNPRVSGLAHVPPGRLIHELNRRGFYTITDISDRYTPEGRPVTVANVHGGRDGRNYRVNATLLTKQDFVDLVIGDPVRNNPSDDPDDWQHDQLRAVAQGVYRSLVLRATGKKAFVGARGRRADESLSQSQRRELLSQAFAIATKQGQRHGYLEPGSHRPTAKGRVRSAARAGADPRMVRKQMAALGATEKEIDAFLRRMDESESLDHYEATLAGARKGAPRASSFGGTQAAATSATKAPARAAKASTGSRGPARTGRQEPAPFVIETHQGRSIYRFPDGKYFYTKQKADAYALRLRGDEGEEAKPRRAKGG